MLEAIQPGQIRPFRQPERSFAPADLSAEAGEPQRALVVGLLSVTAVPVDEIVRQSGLPAPVVQTVLLELELAGRLERHAGGRVSLAAWGD